MNDTKASLRHSLIMDGRYLILPIVKETPERVLRIYVNGSEVTELCVPAGEPGVEYTAFDFETALNLSEYRGRELEIGGDLPKWFWDNLRVSDELPPAAKNRPLIHWSPDVAWGNDPNGMVYHDGWYELYYQYNPANTHWANMSWAHTRSRDLLHWERSETVMLPTPDGTIYSGCGMVNRGSIPNLPEDALLFFYTQAGNNPGAWETGKPFNQNLAYSLDGGKTLIRPSDGTVIPDPKGHTKDPRDPSIYWFKPGGFWYMVLYYGSFHSAIWKSEDLRHWEQIQELDLTEYGMRECADLFSVEREDGSELWIFWTADGYYLQGTFDGERFSHDGIRRQGYGDHLGYAAQCYRDLGGRRITIPWLRTQNEGQNYRGIYGLPREIHAVKRDGEDRLRFPLIPEFYACRKKRAEDRGREMEIFSEENEVLNLEIRAEKACDIHWDLPGMTLCYDAAAGMLAVNTLCPHIWRTEGGVSAPERGAFRLKIPAGMREFTLVYDRGILEVSTDGDAWTACLELPAEHYGGTVRQFSGEPVTTEVYTIQ